MECSKRILHYGELITVTLKFMSNHHGLIVAGQRNIAAFPVTFRNGGEKFKEMSQEVAITFRRNVAQLKYYFLFKRLKINEIYDQKVEKYLKSLEFKLLGGKKY